MRKMFGKSEKDNNFVEDKAILVTGGAGFVGRHLIKKLSCANEIIVSMYHHRLPESLPNVYPVCSDLGSVELLAVPLRGVDTVIYLAWENNFIGPSAQVDINPSFKGASNNIVRLCNLLRGMENANTRRIIFLSANGASRTSSNPFLREKYYAEFAIINSKIREKIIIRPSLVCGGAENQDRFIKSILNLMKFPGFYPVPKIDKTIAPIHIEALVDLIVKFVSIEVKEACTIVDVIGKNRYRIEEIFKSVFDRYVKGTKVQIGGLLGNTLVPVLERRSKDNPNSPTLKDFLAIDNTVDTNLEQGNALIKFLPKKYLSFKEMLQ